MKTRRFLAFLLVVTTLFASSCTSNNKNQTPKGPKNVIVMIGDMAGCEKALRSDRRTSIPKDVLDKVFGYLREALAEETRGEGLTFVVGGDIYVYLRERDSAV